MKDVPLYCISVLDFTINNNNLVDFLLSFFYLSAGQYDQKLLNDMLECDR